MVMFTESMLIPALPTIQAEFNTTATWTSWIDVASGCSKEPATAILDEVS